MRYTFISPERPASPTVEQMLRSSVTAPDLLDLFEIFAVAGSELTTTANTVFAARAIGDRPTSAAITTAKAAAKRVLAACAAVEGGAA